MEARLQKLERILWHAPVLQPVRAPTDCLGGKRLVAGGAWQNDYGVRIDHFLLSAQAADICTLCEIDSSPRGRPKASDHTPICIQLHRQ